MIYHAMLYKEKKSQKNYQNFIKRTDFKDETKYFKCLSDVKKSRNFTALVYKWGQQTFVETPSKWSGPGFFQPHAIFHCEAAEIDFYLNWEDEKSYSIF